GARVFNGFEQSGRRAVSRRQRNSRFRDRLRIIGDHRGAAAQRKRTVIKNDFRLADLNAAAPRKSDLGVYYGAVVEGPVGRSQVLQKVFVTLAAHFGMNARSERIRDTQIVARRAPDRDPQPANLKMLGSAIRIFYD